MTIVFAVLAGIFFVALLAAAFLKVDAQRLAGAMRTAGPIALGAVGGGLLLIGRGAAGGMFLSAALAWYMRSKRRASAKPTPGQRSTVRTAALEMELDHDSGTLEGSVLAGTHEGKMLSALALEDLIALGKELSSDPESLRLLETYLDGRFPVWRENAEADVGSRQSGAPATGPMTKQEAYQILGLEAGASAADIRKAHRRLMQRLHPDLGGTSFLASQINEAKETLLSAHR